MEKTIQDYKGALERIRTSQTRWKDQTRAKIINELTKIAEEHSDLGWRVDQVAEIMYLEGVCLYFPNKPAYKYNPKDVYNVLEKRSGVITKHGGQLYFSMTTNGKVVIWMRYPEIEGVTRKEKTKVFDEYFPVEIDSNIIYEHVGKFLMELTEWEENKSTKREVIGFKLKSKAKAKAKAEPQK